MKMKNEKLEPIKIIQWSQFETKLRKFTVKTRLFADILQNRFFF